MNNQTTDSRSGGTPAPKSDPMTLGTLPIGKLLVQYSVPAIIASVAMSLYNIIDSISEVPQSVLFSWDKKM